jgi:pectate lyase
MRQFARSTPRRSPGKPIMAALKFRRAFGTQLTLAVAGVTASIAGFSHASQDKLLPAFPGAEGAGMYSVGGRGGAVYEVTNLNDDGPGSFRDAVSKDNRTIVFRVSGAIQLKTKLDIKANHLTIAGQTAPGDGIYLRDQCVMVWGQDVILRHLRFRLGDETKTQSDAFTVWKSGAKNIIIDHCSAAFSVDETLSLAGDNQNITVQWCIIGPSLRQSGHVKGSHGFGSLSRANGAVTWHHNLWVHNDARNPRLGDNYGKPPFPRFDVRNNVIYNYGSSASGLTQGDFEANYVGNYIKAGADSKAKAPINAGGKSNLRFFVDGNYFEAKPGLTGEGVFKSLKNDEGQTIAKVVDKPFDTLPVTTTSAKQAYDDVLAKAGATLPKRDAIDQRVILEVRTGTGKMINSQTEYGGWPDFKSAEAPADADHDGMPDAWEKAHHLNPNDPADGAVAGQGGYTNLEIYLNEVASGPSVDPSKQ